MTLPTLEKVWAGRVNVPFIDSTTSANAHRSIVLNLKKHLCNQFSNGDAFHSTGGTRTAAWTVEASSNGVVSNSSDNWNTIGDIVNNFQGSNHSWCLLKFVGPTHTIRLCIDMCSNDPVYWGMLYTVDNAMTGGTLTSRPDSAFDMGIGTTSGNPGNHYLQLSFNLSSVDTHHSAFAINEENGGFFYACNALGSNYFHHFSSFLKAEGTTVDDVAPFHAYAHFSNGGRGAPNMFAGPDMFVGRTYNNGTVRDLGGMGRFSFGGYEPPAQPGSFGPEAGTSEYPCFPVFCFDVSPLRKRRGYFPDWYVVGNPPVGSPYLVSGSPKLYVVGQCLVPFGSQPTM